ncbi:MAG: tetratricopeptide repeat protein [Bacteroidota bacterium]
MKKIRSYFILIIAAAIFSGCSGLNKMKDNADQVRYEVMPEVLETHAGTVDLTIEGTFPENYFDKNTILEATPVLVYGSGETQFENVTLQGENVQANNEVISSSGDNFSYNSSIPFDEAMRQSELMLRITATRKGNSVDFDPIKLADGVIATSTLVQKPAKPIMMADNFKRIIADDKMADIHYRINRAFIRNEELKAEDIAAMKEYLETVKGSEDLEFVDFLVSAYASPDGPLDFNEELSGKRLESARKYIMREFEKAEIEDINKESFFKTETTAEDWEGFKEKVENSNIENKDMILRVLSMYSDPEVREEEIRNMSEAFEELKDDILPQLRRSKLIVNVNKIGRSDQEILEQINSDPAVLDLEELLYAATLTDDLEEQLKYYRIAAEQVPECLRAHNNVGAVSLKLGNTDDAKAAFEKAKAIKNNDVVKNNLGFVALKEGNIEEAEEYFTSMTSSTDESKFGLGTIAIINGEYDKAVNYFANEPSVNNALAHVLKDDLNKAKNMLDNMDEECPVGSYLKAVIGARMDNKDYMLNSLREAIGSDANWKEYAASDLEFARFFNDSEFTSLVQ